MGGDHLITYPILRAVASKFGPVALVHVDAHSDTAEHQVEHVQIKFKLKLGLNRIKTGLPFCNLILIGLPIARPIQTDFEFWPLISSWR